MASVQKLPSGRWRVRWREHANDTQQSRTFAKKGEADRWAAEVTTDINRGTYVRPTNTTFEEYATEWLAGRAWRSTTRQSGEAAILLHALPVLGRMPMPVIRRSTMQSLVAAMSATLAPSTIGLYVGHLSALFADAVDDKLIVESPCKRLKLPSRDAASATIVPLRTDQVVELSETIQPAYLRRWVLVSASLGTRQAELCGLTADRVNFLKRTVRIDRQLMSRPVGFGPCKTTASVRNIPAGEVAINLIAAQLQEFGPGQDGLVFHRDGEPLARHRITEPFQATSKRVGFSASSHDLRHYAASALIESGASVAAVQHFLGHGTPIETMRTYSHLWPTDEERLRTAIDGHLAPVVRLA